MEYKTPVRQPTPGLEKAIRKAGNARLLADRLGVPYQTLHSWKWRGLPLARAKQIAAEMKMRRADFNTDVWGE